MVNLSLEHRVRMDRAATVEKAGKPTKDRRALLTVLVSISVMNMVLLILGVVLAATMNYTWSDSPTSRPPEWYETGSVAGHRAKIFLFYCTIPLVLAALSVYETVTFYHKNNLGPLVSFASAMYGCLLWIEQLSLEASCTWAAGESGSDLEQGTGQYCPFAFAIWPSKEYPLTLRNAKGEEVALSLAWVVPWFAIGMVLLYLIYIVLALRANRHQHADSTVAMGQKPSYSQAYRYRGVDIDRRRTPDIPTSNDIPVLSISEPGTETEGKPPTYRSSHSRSGSMFVEDLPAVKEDQAV